MASLLSSRLVEIIQAFPNVEILVVGDVLLDTYLACHALGVANEAPVPLLEIAGQTHAAGGAGNVAVNLARLGVKTHLIGTVGDDAEGDVVTRLLREASVRFEPLVVHRPTSHKTRILSGQHYYLRLDEEETGPLDDSDQAALAEQIDHGVESVAAVVVSDYDKGTLSESLAGRIEASAQRRSLPIFADLKPLTAGYWHCLKLITPNLMEAGALLAEPGFGAENPAELAARLSRKLASDVVLKLSGQGMVGVASEGATFRLEAACQHPKNVSGAGDTVLSTLSAALACGASLQEAAVLANLAASIAVSHEETHAVSQAELLMAVKGQAGSGFQI